MVTEKNAENAEKYICKKCDFKCSKKSNYTKHELTRKHINIEKGDTANKKKCRNNNVIYCQKCNKIYKSRNGLWKHSKNCGYTTSIHINLLKDDINNDNNDNNDNNYNYNYNDNEILMKENNNFKNIILDMVKNNQELQKQMLEVCKKNNNISNSNNNNSNNSSNSNNKTFNLQIFLNEQCKNAMNLTDFIDSIKLQMSDLENIGTLGYTEGINNIIFKEIIDIDIFSRPFHCSDLKREIIYIKDDNKWEKEDPENKKLKNAIRGIEKKNFKLLNEWAEQHPKMNDYNSPESDKYVKLLNHSTSGDNEHMNKVIKKLVKNITIDKNQ